MGGGSSKPVEEKYMGTSVGDSGPFGTLFDLEKGICKVGLDQGSGTGFLCSFTIDDEFKHYGLLTNNYILSVQDLCSPFKLTFESFKGGKKTAFEWEVDPNERFRFSCPVLDATFVSCKDDEVRELKMSGRLFLELTTDWNGQRGDEVLIVQQQAGFKTRFAHGKFQRNHGLDILHTTSADIGSWGSPLAVRDGRIIGLHKRKAPRNTSQIDAALSTKALIHALSIHCKMATLPTRLISNPVRFDSTSEGRITEHGLVRGATRDNRMVIFVSPEEETDEVPPSPSVGAKEEKTKGSKSKASLVPQKSLEQDTTLSPIWFVPTSHGWYWTPTDPYDRTRQINWMSVSTRYVVGGKDQFGKKMTNRDWQTAKWLRSTGNIQSRK